MAVLVVDTDVASRIHREDLAPEVGRLLVGHTITIAFVTVGELLKWPEARSWGPRRRRELDEWIDRVPVIPYSDAVPRTWAHLAAAAQRRGRPRPVNDMWIAACCIAGELPLVTLNRRDFEDFATHDGLLLLPTS